MASQMPLSCIFLVLAFEISSNAAFNPLELYVGQPEGVALISSWEGTKYPIFDWHWNGWGECDTGLQWSYFDFKTGYNKIHVDSKNEDGTFNLQLSYFLGDELDNGVVAGFKPSWITVTAVELESDPKLPTVMAFQCQNGKYLSISPNSYVWMPDCDSNVMLEPCTQIGICDTCKFTPEVGSVNPIAIEILDITWGEVPGEVIANPDMVAKDQQDNWSDTIVDVTLGFHYKDITTDTTEWEHAWGFEFSGSLESEINYFVEDEKLTIAASASYNGKYGTSNTKTGEVDYDRTATYHCPARSRCHYILIGRKLDDAGIPYTARVRRSLEAGGFKEWEESGVWKGLKVYDTWTQFCTENLDTGESNCPKHEKKRIFPKMT